MTPPDDALTDADLAARWVPDRCAFCGHVLASGEMVYANGGGVEARLDAAVDEVRALRRELVEARERETALAGCIVALDETVYGVDDVNAIRLVFETSPIVKDVRKQAYDAARAALSRSEPGS